MKCAWKELLGLLPPAISNGLLTFEQETVQEIRLRIGQVPEIVCKDRNDRLAGLVRQEDLSYIINAASRYSPWAAQTSARGYLTADGGHRIGICGDVIVKDGNISGIRSVSSVCIRVARDFPGIGFGCRNLTGSILIIGPPGSGKTTLLRDIIRQISTQETVGVVDERGELFPVHFSYGTRLDVLRECPKEAGIEMILRTMGSTCIAVDEITATTDCEALLKAGWCGVRLLATAHAGSVKDLLKRPLYRPLMEAGLFDHVIVLDRMKNWREERICG